MKTEVNEMQEQAAYAWGRFFLVRRSKLPDNELHHFAFVGVARSKQCTLSELHQASFRSELHHRKCNYKHIMSDLPSELNRHMLPLLLLLCFLCLSFLLVILESYDDVADQDYIGHYCC